MNKRVGSLRPSRLGEIKPASGRRKGAEYVKFEEAICPRPPAERAAFSEKFMPFHGDRIDGVLLMLTSSAFVAAPPSGP